MGDFSITRNYPADVVPKLLESCPLKVKSRFYTSLFPQNQTFARMKFFKYHGTGNDFILVDQRFQQEINPEKPDTKRIRKLCDRHFGIGSDGLILLQNCPGHDFEMVFFNPDGSQSMCGNGGRCAVSHAWRIGLFSGHECRFRAIDGTHEAKITPGKGKKADWVELSILPVEEAYELETDHFFMSTGSPHYVQFVEDVRSMAVIREGRRIRNSEDFAEWGGTNVNFVQIMDDGSLQIRTYERGVEFETLSCGTGVAAAATAFALREGIADPATIEVKALGGKLTVRLDAIPGKMRAENLWLCGPAERVFKGEIN